MPQMFPLNWLFLFFYFILVFIMIVMFMYFICLLKFNMLINKKSMNMLIWMW